MRSYRVACFALCHPCDRPEHIYAYMRMHLDDPAACLHEVEARTGNEAKRMAIAEHRQRCLADREVTDDR